MPKGRTAVSVEYKGDATLLLPIYTDDLSKLYSYGAEKAVTLIPSSATHGTKGAKHAVIASYDNTKLYTHSTIEFHARRFSPYTRIFHFAGSGDTFVVQSTRDAIRFVLEGT